MATIPDGYHKYKAFRLKRDAMGERDKLKAKGWKVRVVPRTLHRGTAGEINYILYI